MRLTFHGKVVAVDDKNYIEYIFRNLDEKEYSQYRYIKVTVPPNWNCEKLKKGDTGYVEFDSVSAGENYFKPSEGQIKQYNYTKNYFVSFTREQEQIKTEFKF